MGHRLSLHRTLIEHMVTTGRNGGTWIADLPNYMSEVGRPVRDLVVGPRCAPVASLVVAPLMASVKPTEALMAVYLTSPTPLGAATLQVQYTMCIHTAWLCLGSGWCAGLCCGIHEWLIFRVLWVDCSGCRMGPGFQSCLS